MPQSAYLLPRCGVPTVVSDRTWSSIPSREIMYRASSPPMLWATRWTLSSGNRSRTNRLSSAARWATPRVLLSEGIPTRWPAAVRASSMPGKYRATVYGPTRMRSKPSRPWTNTIGARSGVSMRLVHDTPARGRRTRGRTMAVAKAQPGQTRVGWMGTGVMGRWMCQHAIQKGFSATVYNRSRDKAQPLIDLGAAFGDSPKAVAEWSDVVFAIVGFPKDVREVFLGPNGALAGSKPGTILVDMTTSDPSLAKEIYEAARAKGVHALDAPVSGGDVGAKNAALSIMIGGDKEVVDAVGPVFEAMGKTIVHQGPAGAGQHTKMVNQILISSTMVAMCEGLLYAHKAGLDVETVLKSVSVGAAGSKSLDIYGPRLLARNFEPGFYVEHFIKDLGIALAEAEKMNLCLPGLALTKQLYEAVRAQGYGRKGTQALLLALEAISNVKR